MLRAVLEAKAEKIIKVNKSGSYVDSFFIE